jgi:lipopolysaccharide transport system permease protein
VIDNFRELIRFRSLIMALIERQLALRYRGSLLGFLWSFLNPLCLMLIYTLVFKYYMRIDHSSVGNYSIYLFCGLLPWVMTTSALVEGCSAVVSSGHLITKAMFPAQVLPTVSVVTGLVHYVLSLPLLAVFMLVAGSDFSWSLLALPVVIALHTFLLLGLSWLVAALNVFYRDVQHLVSNLLTFVFFLCPIVYPADAIPEQFRPLMYLNPLALLTKVYHEVMILGVWPATTSWLYLLGWTLLVLLVGSAVFSRLKESFAEAL